jgi:hypothetical protein
MEIFLSRGRSFEENMPLPINAGQVKALRVEAGFGRNGAVPGVASSPQDV